MSFFNLTQLGPQNPIKTIKEESNKRIETSRQEEQVEHKDIDYGLPTLRAQLYSDRSSLPPYKGSHELFTTMRTKHQRHHNGPMDLYPYPMTNSQKYGWWMKYPPGEWTQPREKHVHVNSEMTRFVNDMSATNKDFKLF